MKTPPAPMAGRFPWLPVGLALVVGIPALVTASLCGLLVWQWAGPQFDVEMLNGHVLGGTGDRAAVMGLGTILGAIAIFSLVAG